MEIPVSDTAIEEVGAGPDKWLSQKERDALRFAQNKVPPYPPLATSLQARFFSMFLQGIDCSEIVRLNPGMSLGQLVTARVEGKWDEKRQEHIEKLLRDTALRLQQTTLEGIDFMAAQLAAVHKIEGDKIKRYLQTGDEKELGNFSIKDLVGYRQVLSIMKTLTGQDSAPQKHTGEILHKHEHSVPAANRGMTHGESKSIIEGVLVERRKLR
jgi:hypothetical protein